MGHSKDYPALEKVVFEAREVEKTHPKHCRLNWEESAHKFCTCTFAGLKDALKELDK